MRRPVFTALALLIALGVPAPARAQATPPPAPTPAKPATPPAQPAATQPAAAPAETEPAPSLFALTDREFLIGGRVSSIDGDPARFQRYQDVRDGLLFSGFRYAFAQPDGAYDFHARANNVGFRDQEYFADYNRAGKVSLTGSYQQIPQFYSVDTKTPYTGTGGTLVLDDATQRAIQNGDPAKLNLYVPLAPAFELRERRDIGRVDMVATPKPSLDVTASFTTQKHSGELPWGAGFGFSNDVEVALPYDSRTNDFTIGTEWTNTRNMLRVAYSGSWFDNIAPTLTWDSPLRLDDSSSSGPGRGRMALWPSNSAQTISFAGYTKLARKTQVTGSFSYGLWSNDEPLQAFTINSALPQIALPRANTEGKAHVFSTNLSLNSRPSADWRFSARVRNYTYNNLTPATSHHGHGQLRQLGLGDANGRSGPLRAQPDHPRRRRDVDETDAVRADRRLHAQRQRLRCADLRVERRERVPRVGRRRGILHDHLPRAIRGRLAHRIGARRTAEHRHRRAPGDAAFRPGRPDEKPLLGADRHRPVGRLDLQRVGRNPARRLQQQRLRAAGVDRAHLLARRRLPLAEWPGRGRLLQSRAVYRTAAVARRRSSPAQFDNPLRNWTSDAKETVHYFSIYATPPRIGRNTEVRFSYDYSHADASNLYTIPAGSPIPTPNQLPNVFNKLQQLHIDLRHRLTSKLAATFSYLYEPLKIYDYAFDPSVVNGIVQPSSLVMGYVYRPYTAHSAVFGIRYLW